MSSGKITANGSSPIAARACSTAWPRPSGCVCSARVISVIVAIERTRSEKIGLAAFLQMAFQIGDRREMVEHQGTSGGHDDDDFLDSRGNRFFDH